MSELQLWKLVKIMILVTMVVFAFPQTEDQFVSAVILTLMDSTVNKVSFLDNFDAIIGKG